MNILVTGGSGFLGTWIKKSLKNTNHNWIFPTSSEFDITEYHNMIDFIEGKEIDVIINCAAFTNVDKANQLLDYESVRLNCIGASNLARLCYDYYFKLIHISTDYVFDTDDNMKLFSEVDITNPNNKYGITKLYSEQIISSYLENYLIIRTSWLYDNNKGIVPRLRDKILSNSEFFVTKSSYGSPTYVKDLAEGIINNIDSLCNENGILHITNSVNHPIGVEELVKDIENIINHKGNYSLVEQSSVTKRPRNSALSNKKFNKKFNKLPEYLVSLKDCLNDRN